MVTAQSEKGEDIEVDRVYYEASIDSHVSYHAIATKGIDSEVQMLKGMLTTVAELDLSKEEE